MTGKSYQNMFFDNNKQVEREWNFGQVTDRQTDRLQTEYDALFGAHCARCTGGLKNTLCTHEVCKQTYSWGASAPFAIPYLRMVIFKSFSQALKTPAGNTFFIPDGIICGNKINH